jgi:hypothetical protein
MKSSFALNISFHTLHSVAHAAVCQVEAMQWLAIKAILKGNTAGARN